MPLFDAKYLTNGTRYRCSYSELLIGTYAFLNDVILIDLERLCKRFSDMKHRTVFLQQLSFLL